MQSLRGIKEVLPFLFQRKYREIRFFWAIALLLNPYNLKIQIFFFTQNMLFVDKKTLSSIKIVLLNNNITFSLLKGRVFILLSVTIQYLVIFFYKKPTINKTITKS